ncbi:MAG: DinB family protein [Phycisphaerae bacterium]|nr:DinB family protein [Phycisphaerae bacterium]
MSTAHTHGHQHSKGHACKGDGSCGGKGECRSGAHDCEHEHRDGHEHGHAAEPAERGGYSGPGVSALPPLEPAAKFKAMSIPDLLRRYRKGIENFDRRIFWLDADQLDFAFLPEADVGRWPVRVLLGHLADAEIVFSHRMRRAVGEDNPVLSVWDENAFIDHNIYGGTDTEGLSPEAAHDRVVRAVGGAVAMIHTTRQWTGDWLLSLRAEQFDRMALHPERGGESVKQMLSYAAWHLEHHARYLACKLDRLVGKDATPPKAEGSAEGSAGGSGGCGSGCGCHGQH